MGPSPALIIPASLFVLTFILNIPLPFGILAGSTFYFLVTGMDIGYVANHVLSNLYTRYIIMAVPLFVFTAKIMNTGLVTEKVFNFANSLVGKWQGGMGHVNVVASLIFSGMTGSAVADASGLGLMEIESMRREGYADGFSCAITAASATIGPVFPPSIPMVFYAMLSGTSIGHLFMGGMVPGLIVAIALMIYIAIIAKRRGYPRGPAYAVKEFLAMTLVALPALMTPVILLGGIYTGVMTPTEAGAVAAFYGIIISILVYRAMGLKKLWEIIKETVLATGMLSIMVGSAFAFSFIVAYEDVPQVIASQMLGLTTNPYVLLLIINVVFLIFGMFIDTTTKTVVFIPMVLPLIQELGISFVHFGVVIVLNMMIGLSTPPFGMLLFIVSGISGTPLMDVIKETLPMLVVLIIVLLLITFFPQLVLFLPNTLL